MLTFTENAKHSNEKNKIINLPKTATVYTETKV